MCEGCWGEWGGVGGHKMFCHLSVGLEKISGESVWRVGGGGEIVKILVTHMEIPPPPT